MYDKGDDIFADHKEDETVREKAKDVFFKEFNLYIGEPSGEQSKMSEGRKSIPQSKIVGMKVYNSDATYLGEVKDIGFIPGEKNIMLHVQTSSGMVKEIDWDGVGAVADIIILKVVIEIPKVAEIIKTAVEAKAPVTVQAATPPNCPTCGKPATWIQQYSRYYCYTCKKYL